MTYKIIKRKTERGWEVEWDGKIVFKSFAKDAEFHAAYFANGLEMGITNNKEPLNANSKIKIEEWYDYLSAFDSYEDYK